MATPAISNFLTERNSRARYVAFLGRYFQMLQPVVPLVHVAVDHLPQRLDWLRDELLSYTQDESGRAEWLLRDLASAGGSPDLVTQARPPANIRDLHAWLRTVALGDEAVGICGILYVIDATGMILGIASNRMQKRLALPDRAFTFLRSAGAVEREHARFLQRVLARLDSDRDRAVVAGCAARMYRLTGEVLGQAELRRRAASH
jgi:hypothetical protein